MGKNSSFTPGAYSLDARQGQTSIMTDLGKRRMVQEWLKKKDIHKRNYQQWRARNNEWRQRKKYTVPETLNPPLTRKQKYRLLSPIPRTLTALLSINIELMSRSHIEEFLSHLVSSNTNMSFMGTYFGSCLRHQGQLCWDYLPGTKSVNYYQNANNVKDTVMHILYISWFTGDTTRGH
jgi:hypothetical protein